MNGTRFIVEFRGNPPADAKVGDELEIHGTVTIKRIGADLIDVSGPGKTTYLPGEIAIELYSNHLEVSPA
jgi:hypothetical protein